MPIPGVSAYFQIILDKAHSCFQFKERTSCESSSTLSGVTCNWKLADKSVTYETCTFSEEVLYCPNNVCDDLERQFENMCPQDCASR